MPSYPFWPGRVVEPNTPAIAKLKKSPSSHCVFFFGSNNYGWIEEKSLRPFAEFKDEFKPKGKPKDLFDAAMNDIESFIENPANFSALFEPKTIQKKKASPKPKKQDIELDFDSLKSDSSVPSSPSPTKTPSSTPKAPPKRSISVKSAEKVVEKPPKVPVSKRKTTRESDPTDALEPEILPTPSKKSRKSSQVPIGSPPRNEAPADSSPRRSFVVESKPKTSRRSTVEASSSVFGFVGLGILGRSILHNLLKTGHEVVIWNRTLSRCDEFVAEYGAKCTAVSTPREVFEQAQITMVCVADSEAVKETICDGENGIIAAENLSMDKGLVMLSSIDCETSQDISTAISMKGQTRYLEAQIQNQGSPVVLAAGDQTLYDDCKSCFKAVSKFQHFLGEEVGTAVKMNLVLQSFSGIAISAIAESFALADSFKLQLADILEIISISNLQSAFLMDKCRVIINEEFNKPAMKIESMQKQLKMAIEFGDASEQPLPLAATSNEMFKSAKRLGFGQEDVASVYLASLNSAKAYGTENGI